MFHYHHDISGLDFEWNWSKTINVFRNGKNIDCFSLNYGRDHNAADAVEAILQYANDLDNVAFI